MRDHTAETGFIEAKNSERRKIEVERRPNVANDEGYREDFTKEL
jgi:hypothetical protein